MTAVDRLRAAAEIVWAGRPRWWDYLYAAAGLVIFFAVLHEPLLHALIGAAIVLLGGPWVDIAIAWIRHGRHHTCTCGDEPGDSTETA